MADDDALFVVPKLDVQKKMMEEKKRLENSIDYIDKALEPSLRRYAEGYKPPTGEEIRTAFTPFKAREIANLLGVTDARTIRRWISGESTIPYSAWRLYLILTNRVQEESKKI